jgi:hypothetical protein
MQEACRTNHNINKTGRAISDARFFCINGVFALLFGFLFPGGFFFFSSFFFSLSFFLSFIKGPTFMVGWRFLLSPEERKAGDPPLVASDWHKRRGVCFASGGWVAAIDFLRLLH